VTIVRIPVETVSDDGQQTAKAFVSKFIVKVARFDGLQQLAQCGESIAGMLDVCENLLCAFPRACRPWREVGAGYGIGGVHADSFEK